MIVECPGCKSRYDVAGRPPGTRARCRCGSVFELPHPSTQAGMLACPGCGGNVAATSHTCEYCSAELLVRACPRCFARIFHGAKHCSCCGAESVVPARANMDGEASRLACPRCEQALLGRLVDEVLIDECPGCHGVWVDMVALERILSERRQARADNILGAWEAACQKSVENDAGETPSGRQGRVYIGCPECTSMMNRRNFARGSGVIVDVCRNHGTWFDGGELPSIIDFVMKGGLESAARKEAELLREEARRAEVAARSMRRSASYSIQPGLRSVETDRVGLFGSLLGAVGSLLIDV